MKISTYTFNKYLTQTYIDNFEGTFGTAFKNKDITFLTFDKWEVFYEADPDNWKFHHDTYAFHRDENIYFPYYFYIENGGNAYRLIKFPTKREYKKFYRFYKKNIEHNLDGRENQQEILELAQIIGEKAKIRTKETQKKLQEDYKDYYKIVEKCNKNTSFGEFFPTECTVTSTLDQDNSTFVFNKVPYLIKLKPHTKVYTNEYGVFSEKVDQIGYTYTLGGIHRVIEEKFYKGFTYCKLDGFPGDVWVKIADIEEKIV